MSNPYTKENGGPAFPISIPGCGDNGAGGMTLRDYMAAHSSINEDGISLRGAEALMNRKAPDYVGDPVASIYFWAAVRAKLRFIEAAAMLAARGES